MPRARTAISICSTRSTTAWCASMRRRPIARSSRSSSPKTCSRPTSWCGKGNIFVWDGAPQALQANGRDDEPVRELTRTRTARKARRRNPTAFAQMGSQPPDSPDQLLDEKSRGIAGPARAPVHRHARPRHRDRRRHPARQGRHGRASKCATRRRTLAGQLRIKVRTGSASSSFSRSTMPGGCSCWPRTFRPMRAARRPWFAIRRTAIRKASMTFRLGKRPTVAPLRGHFVRRRRLFPAHRQVRRRRGRRRLRARYGPST